MIFSSNTIKHVYCIGIGGIGLSGIAEILLHRGYKVSGTDIKPTELTDNLAKKGATIFTEHKQENIEGCDVVIYSAAVASDNPEIVYAHEHNIPVLSRAEMLGIIMKEYANNIAISGTHGKTTTTSMISLIMLDNLLDPTILIGGNLDKIGGNVRIGKSSYFITEACEYVDSFLELHPKIEVILNIDSDHLDYFKDIDHIVKSFDKFANLVPKDGLIIAYSANPFVSGIINNVHCPVITFGYDNCCDYYAENIKFNSNGMPSFDVLHEGSVLGNIQLAIPGEHNISNALAAISCSHTLGTPFSSIKKSLESFTGTGRRFDVIGVLDKGAKVIDDYAHHPEEIKATLKACTNINHNKLWCIFQPHTFTRTKALFNEFITAFDNADNIILTDIYAAREKNIYQIKSSDLVEAIKKKYPHKYVRYISEFEDICAEVLKKYTENDLILTMGAGDIFKVAEMLVSN